jgi:hypothetical protein
MREADSQTGLRGELIVQPGEDLVHAA